MLVFELLVDMALTFEDIFVLLSLLASLLLLGWRSMNSVRHGGHVRVEVLKGRGVWYNKFEGL